MLQPRPYGPCGESGSGPEKIWVELTVENKEGDNTFIGQVDSPLDRSIFSKGSDDFVKLERVRWREDMNDLEFRIVRQEEQNEDYQDTLYIKKRKIIYVCPIRPDSAIWADPAT
ncbi:MAG: hypothetical protein HY720_09210 [Planctomycetes bacterium]|nr:hypothetical protein [Planctomycetota bacterium]